MSMMDRLQRGSAPKPPIGLIYGRPGVGKTTLAAQAPGAIFVQTEDGLTSPHLRDVPTFGVLTTYDDVMNVFAAIAENAEAEGWKTIVIDSIDRLSPLITEKVCAENGWRSLEDGAYGKGKSAYVEAWRDFMTCLLALRNECGLGILMLGHHKAVKVTPPDAEPFQQYGLTIHDEASRILVGDSDFVLFATYPMHTISTDQGFGKKATRAITDKAVLWTTESGARVAKNRYGMPEKLPLDFATLAQFIPSWAESAQQTVQSDAAE